jgi:hypothetical protein
MLCDRQREPYAPCRQQRRLENVVDRDLLRKERHAQRLVVMAPSIMNSISKFHPRGININQSPPKAHQPHGALLHLHRWQSGCIADTTVLAGD